MPARDQRRPVGTYSSGMKQRVKLAQAVRARAGRAAARRAVLQPRRGRPPGGGRPGDTIPRHARRSRWRPTTRGKWRGAMSDRAWSLRAAAVLAKELRSELRSRVALNAVGLFALTTLVAVAYQIGPVPHPASRTARTCSRRCCGSSCSSPPLSGLARVFVKEEDAHTAKTLRLAAAAARGLRRQAPLQPRCSLLALEAASCPLYCALMGFSVAGVPGLVARAGRRGASRSPRPPRWWPRSSRAPPAPAPCSPILTVPLALPLLVVLIQGTRAAAAKRRRSLPSSRRCGRSSRSPACTLVASVFLFPVVWHD